MSSCVVVRLCKNRLGNLPSATTVNYGFPQELDDEFLVISDDFVGAPWRYTDINGLLEILKEKIDQVS